jgi:hypothetical protein
MKLNRKILLIIAFLSLLLTGCALFKNPNLHKLAIQVECPDGEKFEPMEPILVYNG